MTVDIRAQAGRAAAMEAADRRREIQDDIRSGAVTVEVLLMTATMDPAVGRMKVRRAIRSYPGWNVNSTEDVLRQLRIPAEARLSYLLGPAKSDLAKRLDEAVKLGPGNRPSPPSQWPLFERWPLIEGLDD